MHTNEETYKIEIPRSKAKLLIKSIMTMAQLHEEKYTELSKKTGQAYAGDVKLHCDLFMNANSLQHDIQEQIEKQQ